LSLSHYSLLLVLKSPHLLISSLSSMLSLFSYSKLIYFTLISFSLQISLYFL
jgi:hypothetical protein